MFARCFLPPTLPFLGILSFSACCNCYSCFFCPLFPFVAIFCPVLSFSPLVFPLTAFLLVSQSQIQMLGTYDNFSCARCSLCCLVSYVSASHMLLHAAGPRIVTLSDPSPVLKPKRTACHRRISALTRLIEQERSSCFVPSSGGGGRSGGR